MGVINKQIVYCCHQVFVLCSKGVAAGFSRLEDAQRFLAGREFRSGFIYRHNGSDWDKVEDAPRLQSGGGVN